MRVGFCLVQFLILLIASNSLSLTRTYGQGFHGQVITRIFVAEHVEAVGAAAAKSDKVYIGPCHFLRCNGKREDWKSYVDAYLADGGGAKNPFVYEKFPKVLNFFGQKAVSENHPVKVIDKERVGFARFYFAPVPTEFDLFRMMPLPTDKFNMSFAKGLNVKFHRDLTPILSAPKTKDATSYTVQIKMDGPNNVSRTDKIGDAYKYRVSLYVVKPDEKLEHLKSIEPFDNAVEYRLLKISIPNKFAIKGQFKVIGRIFRNEKSFTDPEDPGHGWSGFQVIGGESAGFEKYLKVSKGVKDDQ